MIDLKLLWVGVVIALTGCVAATPQTIVHQRPIVVPAQHASAAPSNGAIFNAATYRPMFEDRRARLVGDTLTINIAENTSAGKKAGASASKSGSTSIGFPRLFGVPAGTLGNLGVNTQTANNFKDEGAENLSNSFAGSLAVTVVEVLPNGHLLVSGEKQIALDRSVEYVRFSGVVNPDTVGPGNMVASSQVADARVEYRTNTRLDGASLNSALAKFFLSMLPL